MLKTVLSVNKVGDKYEVELNQVLDMYNTPIFMQAFSKKPKIHVADITSAYSWVKRKRVLVNDLTFWVDELEVYGRIQKV